MRPVVYIFKRNFTLSTLRFRLSPFADSFEPVIIQNRKGKYDVTAYLIAV